MKIAEVKAKQDRDLSEQHAKLQIGQAVVEWELKQSSLLYGPMRALLRQSVTMYRQMNQALVSRNGNRFRLSDTERHPDGWGVFQIQTSPAPGSGSEL